VCRLPLEVEIYRNFKHSLIGKKLRQKSPAVAVDSTREWYKSAQTLVETEMQDIAENAQGGQIDAATLNDEAAEMLQLYIDNQVCVWCCYGCCCRLSLTTTSITIHAFTGILARSVFSIGKRRGSWDCYYSRIESSHGHEAY